MRSNLRPVRLLLLLAWCGTGCDQTMSEQPKRMPLEASRFFADGRSSRSPVPGTVAVGQLALDAPLFLGRVGQDAVDSFPFPVTRETLERGRQRFDIFCAPCHDRTGSGRGRVVRRGFKPPPTYHQERLRSATVGHLFDVITRGQGAMPDYAAQIPARDRWAIVAYIRALQESQNAREDEVPPEELQALEDQTP
ncbi:MAG TPA: cytochrome c [Planctomycetota bacterium]|nr:cytochrome c [Planctomycetota bacterium]